MFLNTREILSFAFAQPYVDHLQNACTHVCTTKTTIWKCALWNQFKLLPPPPPPTYPERKKLLPQNSLTTPTPPKKPTPNNNRKCTSHSSILPQKKKRKKGCNGILRCGFSTNPRTSIWKRYAWKRRWYDLCTAEASGHRPVNKGNQQEKDSTHIPFMAHKVVLAKQESLKYTQSLASETLHSNGWMEESWYSLSAQLPWLNIFASQDVNSIWSFHNMLQCSHRHWTTIPLRTSPSVHTL